MKSDLLAKLSATSSLVDKIVLEKGQLSGPGSPYNRRRVREDRKGGKTNSRVV